MEHNFNTALSDANKTLSAIATGRDINNHQAVASFFLESTLGFGQPVTHASIRSIFAPAADDKQANYSQQNDNYTASLNGVKEHHWQSLHVGETIDNVLHNALMQPLVRIKTFIDKRIAHTGYAVDKLGQVRDGEIFLFLVNSIEQFYEDYKATVDVGATLLSSISLTQTGRVWNVRVRALIAGEGGSVFINVLFKDFVRSSTPLVLEGQLRRMKNVLDSFGSTITDSRVLTLIPKYSFSDHLIQLALRGEHRNSPDGIYGGYFLAARSNKDLIAFEHGPNIDVETFNWVSLPESTRIIIVGMIEMNDSMFKAFLNLNQHEMHKL